MTTDAKLNVQQVFRGMDSSDAVKEYAEKRASKLSKHLHEQITVSFAFSVEKNHFISELHVSAGDFDAKASAQAETLYAAIDEVTDKALQQSRKFKEKNSDHSGNPHHNQ